MNDLLNTTNNQIEKLWADESGDSGFKFATGSSRHLVIATVYTIGNVDLVSAVDEFRKNHNIVPQREFKFSRNSNMLRHDFLEYINRLDWHYKAIVVDKQNLRAPALVRHPHQLYCELLRRLLYDNNPPLEKAILTIDEAVAKIHHREFNAVLKQYLSKNTVKKIRQARSKNDTMLQVADIVSGAIFRCFEKDDDQYLRLIENKQQILIEF